MRKIIIGGVLTLFMGETVAAMPGNQTGIPSNESVFIHATVQKLNMLGPFEDEGGMYFIISSQDKCSKVYAKDMIGDEPDLCEIDPC